MKSKMKVLTHIIILIFVNLKLICCDPFFGDEFVHIKVHLPKDTETHVHGSPVLSHAPIVPKVIHHYHHRRRKPLKKHNPFGKHTDLLESILLSEVKKPISPDHYKYLNHAEDIAKHVDTYLVKDEKPKTHVETYKLIEETKPKEIVETFKVIENKPQHLHSHKHYEAPAHIDTVKIVDSHDDEDFHYKHKPHTETYKVIDSLFDDYNAHIKEPSYEYGPSTRQRVKSVKIVETKAPHKHSEEYSINFDKHPHSETVEIVKTNRHNHHHHFNHDHKTHGYHYKTSQEDNFPLGGYNYKTPKYQGNHHSGASSHYTHDFEPESFDHESDHYVSEDTYIPPSKYQSPDYHQHHYHHHGAARPNSIYEEDTIPTIAASPSDSYLPLPVTQSDHRKPNIGSMNWPTSGNGGQGAAETYTGIDSYSANHVQGVGSSGYQYPSPYP